jgi:class III poly(R)-hydroxyalkanoic acid synthase PhaE subunit
MQWDKPNDTPLNGWFGMQEKMLKGWWDVLGQNNGHAGATVQPLWNLWTQPWQAAGIDPTAAFTPELMADSMKQALGQFMSGQAQAQQLMNLVNEAWQSMLTNAASPVEWQKALSAFTDQLRQQMNMAMNSAKLLENNTELWRLYSAEAQKFTQPWLNAWGQTPAFMSKLSGADQANATNEFMQLFQAAFEQTWGRALFAPNMGLLRELNEKVNKGFALWLENQQLTIAYQLLIGEAWIDAFRALMQKLMSMAQKGETLTDQRHLLRIWVEVADEVFIALFHSEAYAKTQSAYVNSNMALRRQQRELLEVWLRGNDMPTRSDLDEAHHQIYQLRKDMKALKKTLAAQATTFAAATPVSERKKPVRAARKPRQPVAAPTESDTPAANGDGATPEQPQ